LCKSFQPASLKKPTAEIFMENRNQNFGG